jgi:ABC-type antimicrobial peptide transport system permease subunit
VSKYPPITDQDGARTQSIEIDGVPIPRGSAGRVYFNGGSEGYFRTLGIRILHGRDFGAQDAASATRVAAINESFALRFFGGQDPIGRRVSIGLNENRRNLEIVAVVSDAKYQRLEETPLSIAYVPRAQATDILAGNLYAQVRATGTLVPLRESVRRAVREVDPRVPLRVETVDDRIRHSLVRERVTTLIAAGLGITALVLACAALYGLLAYTVSRQTYEIGLRIALGAGRRGVLWLVLRECLVLATLGTMAGLAGAVALSRFVRSSFVFQISPADPIALAASALLVVAVAALAGSIPARRAARIDPAIALRAD